MSIEGNDASTPPSELTIVQPSAEGRGLDPRRVRRVLSSKVLTGNAFRVNTPVCGELVLHLLDWLECGESGALIVGWPRLGKTAATRWALDAVQRDGWMSCWVPWTEVPCRATGEDGVEIDWLSNERNFFRYLLTKLNYRYELREVGRMRSQLTKLIVSKARRCEIGTYVLFFDEAQKLRRRHYEWLLELSNEVNQADCRVFCLLVGQPELLQRRTELEDQSAEQLLDRFMLRDLEFRGLLSKEELIDVLKAFDGVAWPANSGLRFPQHYVQELCDRGWHLDDLGDMMWQAFSASWLSAGLAGTPVVPMGHFAKTLVRLLNMRAHVTPGSPFTEEQMKTAVAHSRFIQSAVRRFGKPVHPNEHDDE